LAGITGEGAGLIGAVVGAVIVLVVWGFFNRLLHIPKRTTVPILNWKFFGWGGCVMGRAISGHLNDGATEPEKRQRRAEAHKIRKMIRKCKADTKAIKQLDDEQTEFLERLRKHP